MPNPNPYQPQFAAIIVEPNPVVTGETVYIIIAVTDEEIIPQIVAPYAGEVYAGEEVML